MPSLFPGMNPYLEHPGLWAGVHHRLITAIANAIEPQIQPKYIVAIEERVYDISGNTTVLVGVPDVAVQVNQTLSQRAAPVHMSVAEPVTQPIEVTLPVLDPLTESYLEIRAVETGVVITTIEVLSPKNKQAGVSRLRYESKRAAILSSPSHFIEIDLLRQGQPMTVLDPVGTSHYRILVSRSHTRPKADLYAFNLPDLISTIPIPLGIEDDEPRLQLQQLVDAIYDRGGYALRINYQDPPVPRLSDSDARWLETTLQKSGIR